MGLIIGSGSFTRFTVEGTVPEEYRSTYPLRISRFAFRSLDELSDQERSAGWVNIMDMFDGRFMAMEYLKEPCIAMSWRVDTRKVPSKALKQYCREAEEAVKEKEGLEFLPKNRRQDIKEGMLAKLIKRAIPQSHTYDMIWNLQTGVVIFGATANKLCDEFAEFFLKCFGLNLKTIFPYSIASQVLEKEGMDPGVLDGLRPFQVEVKS
ncbi:MAG: recombination-associated protein RdgC [Pseudomonadota bacterium]